MSTKEELTKSLAEKIYDYEAELVVLGTALFNPKLIYEVVSELEESDFSSSERKTAFRTLQEAVRKELPLETSYLIGLLKEKGLEDNALYWLEYAVEESSLKGYLQRLKDKRKRRKIFEAAQRLADLTEKPLTAEELLEEAEKVYYEIFKEEKEANVLHFSDAIEQTLEPIVLAASKGIPLEGLPFPFRDLNLMTGGLRKEELTLVAARPSVGKTAFSLQIASYVASLGYKVLFFSLEMPISQLQLRILSQKTLISLTKIRSASLTKEEIEFLISSAEETSRWPFYFSDTSDLTPVKMIKQIEDFIRIAGEPDLIVVDYLQLMRTERRASRQEEVAEISRSLKRIAKKYKVPVVALSQLSRQVEQRADKRPQLSDLRESGALEQDADLILFLHRPKKEEENDKIELIIGKNRNGATGVIELYFLRKAVRFYGVEDSDLYDKDREVVERREYGKLAEENSNDSGYSGKDYELGESNDDDLYTFDDDDGREVD